MYNSIYIKHKVKQNSKVVPFVNECENGRRYKVRFWKAVMLLMWTLVMQLCLTRTLSMCKLSLTILNSTTFAEVQHINIDA